MVRRSRGEPSAGIFPIICRGEGAYSYTDGINRPAMIALLAGIAVALAGLAHPALRFLFDGARFSATVVAAGVYVAMMRRERM